MTNRKYRISIFHQTFDSLSEELNHTTTDHSPKYEPMGYFWLRDEGLSFEDIADETFKLTQNIDNYSWSRNFPYNLWDAKPLQIIEGNELGHRSSMMNDIFEIEEHIDGEITQKKTFRVEMIGMEEID